MNGFYEYPQCYLTISDELSEALFLEDLTLRQFDMFKFRGRPITFQHISLVVRALGKFHAISFALKDQQPQKFKQLSSQLSESFWDGILVRSNYEQLYHAMLEKLLACLEEEKRSDLADRFRKMNGNQTVANLFQLISGKWAEPYSVICHGDATINNSMFHNDQANAIEVQLIDWQFSRYASPVIELVLYLLCSTTKELRSKHYEDIVKIYHDSLSDLLTRYLTIILCNKLIFFSSKAK